MTGWGIWILFLAGLTSAHAGRIRISDWHFPCEAEIFKQTYLPLVEKHRGHADFHSLAWDPARRRVSTYSQREAAGILEAVELQLVKGPVTRGPAEIDFYDREGFPIDVKTPPSNVTIDTWHLEAERAVASILEKTRRRFAHRETGTLYPILIVLDVSYLTWLDYYYVWQQLRGRASPDELARIIEVGSPLEQTN